MDKGFPVIRITLQGMKQEIAYAFGIRQLDLSAEVDEALDEVIRTFDYEAVVKNAASEVIREEIYNFFKYGVGRSVIKEGLHNAFSKLISLNKEDDDETTAENLKDDGK